jgi:hypothetical protein
MRQTHLNRLALLIALAPLTSSTSPEGNLPSALHFLRASLEDVSPTASTSENCLNPPNVSNCYSSAFNSVIRGEKTYLNWHCDVQTMRIGFNIFQRLHTRHAIISSSTIHGVTKEVLTKPTSPRSPSWKGLSSRRMDSIC